MKWSLNRNCSISPAQLGGLYLSLCVVSLGIAAVFWMHGAKLILPFAWLELTAVGIALVVYARHATDGERIALQDGRLSVELEHGGRCEHAEFARHHVRVEPQAGDRSLICVSAQGRSIMIGRHVRPEWRSQLAREIRMALRGC